MPSRDEPDPLALQAGVRIRDLRLEKGMSIAQLAKASGISKGHLSSIEHGRAMLNAGTIMKLARGLGIEGFYILLCPESSPQAAQLERLRRMSPEELRRVEAAMVGAARAAKKPRKRRR
jgi:transcriptional regulator with XRE-family HTH domain